MNCLGDLTWHQKMRTNWLSSSRIICLPTRNPHLRSTSQHVPKPENYDSDSGYESDGTDDTRHVVKELSDDSRYVIKNLADDSRDVLKDLAPENTTLKARVANLGDDYIISAFELDQKIEKAQGKDASTLRQWERAARYYETRRPLDQGGRPRCCGKQRA